MGKLKLNRTWRDKARSWLESEASVIGRRIAKAELMLGAPEAGEECQALRLFARRLHAAADIFTAPITDEEWEKC